MRNAANGWYAFAYGTGLRLRLSRHKPRNDDGPHQSPADGLHP
jgi:hypothetical protein